MEPLDYLRLLRRRWPIVAAAAVVAVAGAWLTAPDDPGPGQVQARQYTATHTLLQERMEGGGGPRLELIATLASTGGDVPRRVAQRLGGDIEPVLLASQVTITADDELGTLSVSTTHEDSERAVVLADTFAQELLEHFDAAEERHRQEELTLMRQQIASLEEQVREVSTRLPAEQGDTLSGETALALADRESLLARFQSTKAQMHQLESQGPASIGLRTFQPAVAIPVVDEGFQAPSSRRSRTAIGGLLGLGLGLALAIMLDRIDTRLRSRRAAEQAFGLPVVADIPRLTAAERRDHAIVTLTRPGSYAAEAYRVLRLSVQLMPRWILPVANPFSGTDPEHPLARVLAPRTTEEPARVVLVTSPAAGEGKSTTVANLAASFAEVGKVVLVLDCDFRYPQMHRFFDVGPEPGVSDFLQRGGSRPELAALAQETGVPGVWVVPSGAPPDNPGELIGPDQELISTAAELADVVLVDTGPMLAVNDPAALMPRADAVVVVARSGRTTLDEAARTSELLARIEAPVLGVALVGGPRSAKGGRYYTHSRSGTADSALRLHGLSPVDRVEGDRP